MEGVIRVAEKNKGRRKHQHEENTVGSGMGVVPEDTIAQACGTDLETLLRLFPVKIWATRWRRTTGKKAAN